MQYLCNFPLRRVRYIEHEGQKLNCILLSLQLMPHVQGMEVDQDGDNLTWQMPVSLFHLLSCNIELCIGRFKTKTNSSVCTSIVCMNHACISTGSCSNYSISLLTYCRLVSEKKWTVIHCLFQVCHKDREWCSIMQDGDNLTRQMLVSLFQSLS